VSSRPSASAASLAADVVRASVDDAYDAIVITDAELERPGPRIVYVNEALCRMTGYRRDELLGRTPRIFQGRDTERTVLDRLKRQLAAGERFEGETVNYRKDGVPFVLQWRISPVRDASGRTTHFVSNQRDVTAEREAAAKLEQARAEAVAANAAKTEFVLRVSHELRTPLNAIIGFASLLEEAELAPEDRDSVRQIAESGAHLLSIIGQLTDISRIESGELQLSLAPVRAAAELRDVVELATPLARRRGVELEAAVDPDDDVAVRADRDTLRQVLLNLVSNGIKYNRERGRVRLSLARAPDGRVDLVVADTGIGMSSAELGRLFGRFVRMGDVGRVPGTGLGLNIAETLTEAMGGELLVASSAGAGSTFAVRLPAATAG
jgi:PAS domain S-box-containing protein